MDRTQERKNVNQKDGIGVERRKGCTQRRTKAQRKQIRKGGKKLSKHNNKERGRRCLSLPSDHRNMVRRRGDKLRTGFEAAAAVFASMPEQGNNRHAENREYLRHCLNCTLAARYERRANRKQTGGRSTQAR